MRYFFDTEFIEDGKTIDLISIGIVAEDSRELYFQNVECDLEKANDWVKKNVFPNIERLDVPFTRESQQMKEYPRKPIVIESWASRNTIKERIYTFCNYSGPNGGEKPEFWSYYADYDWVALCQLFGRMIDLPSNWPQYCMDIKQFAKMVGNPELPKQQESVANNALTDARWHKQMFEWLINQYDLPLKGN